MPERIRSLDGWHATLLVALVTALTAALTRLPWLASSPPGFSLAEAQAALTARDLSTDELLNPTGGPFGSHEPLFSGLLWLTGSLAGWDAGGARLAAALLGMVAAVACALWYRRALGPLAGLLGGLLVATTFPWLVLSRQAQPAIGAAAVAALGLYCLWEGLGPRQETSIRAALGRRGWWIVAAGLLFGLGLSIHPAFLPALVIAPASAALLIWRGDDQPRDLPSQRWLIAGLACLLLVAAPTIIDGLTDPDALRQRIEQDWNGDGRPERLSGPLAAVSGYADTLLALGWRGHASATLGTPGRALLDPILLILSIAGLAVVLSRPHRPLHLIVLLWLVGFGAPAALLDPGNPALLMPLTPVLFALPLLGLRAIGEIVAGRGQRTRRLAMLLTIGAVSASIVWSLSAYRDWTRSDTTYFAFDADLREALAAVDRLAPGTNPVYIAATPESAPLLDYFGPPDDDSGRVQRPIDNQTTLVIPAEDIGYLVTTASQPLPDSLSRLLDGQRPAVSGETHDGTAAWQIWITGQALRDALPWTLPTLDFPDGFTLAGFDIRPDLGDVAASGSLPDPPRVLVTLVWNVPRGATAHIARVRLLPIDPTIVDPDRFATTSDTWLITSPPIAAGNRGHEIIVAQLSVPVPESPNLIVEVQAGLLRGDGSIQPPTSAGSNSAGDYVLLNRVQYVRDRDATP